MALKVLLLTISLAFLIRFNSPEVEAAIFWTAGSKKHKEPCAETFHQTVVKRIGYGEHHAFCKGTVVRYKCTDHCAVKNNYGKNIVDSYKKGYGDYSKGDGNWHWQTRSHKGSKDYKTYYKGNDLGYNKGYKGSHNGYFKGYDYHKGYGQDLKHEGSHWHNWHNWHNSAGYRHFRPGYRVFTCCGPTHYEHKKQHVHFNCGRFGHKKVEWITKEPVGCNCKFC